MKSSIFTFIKSYTPSVDRDPKEDYLTQIFSWMLNNIKELDKKYCRYLLDKIGKSNIELNEEMISTETQISVTSGRIDMVISIYNKIGFICEHKVWSNLSDNQITKYKQCSNELGNENYYTVLVTANKLQHTQEADIKLTWADICIFIESIINEYENEDEFVLSNFIIYLKEQGLWKYESISINEVTSYYSARKLEKKLDELFMDLVHVEWEKECEHLKTFTKSRYNPNFTKYRWGRKGIDFFEDWYPGLFAGVMLDPTDHCIDTKDSDRGPDLVVILDIEYRGKKDSNNCMRNRILNSDKYIELKEVLRNMNGTFEEVKSKNNWRLIVIRKPLVDVLENKYSYEEQLNAMKESIIEGINILTKVKLS